LLRATTEKLLIVANGTLAEFQGDLDDYRDWLLKRDVAPKPAKAPKSAAAAKAKPVNRKPIEARIKRLEEIMNRLNLRKASIDARLADPALYQDPQALKLALQDQAYVAREIEQVEAEWLQKQAELDEL